MQSYGNYMPNMNMMPPPYAPEYHMNQYPYYDPGYNMGHQAYADKYSFQKQGEHAQYMEPQLYDYFLQEMAPKKNKPQMIFEKYKQTNNLEDIAEEESLNDSATQFDSLMHKKLSISSAEEPIKRPIGFSRVSKNKEPWELETSPYPDDVFFDANESKRSRKLLNVSDSMNLASPLASGRLIARDLQAKKGNVSEMVFLRKVGGSGKVSVGRNLESPLLEKFIVNKTPKEPESIVQIRKYKASEKSNKMSNHMSPSSLILKKKKGTVREQRVNRSKEKEKVVVSRSKSPVTSAYKKILLENTSKNLNIKEVVQKSLQKNRTRRLSLSPDNEDSWKITKQEKKIIKKNSSEGILNNFDSLRKGKKVSLLGKRIKIKSKGYLDIKILSFSILILFCLIKRYIHSNPNNYIPGITTNFKQIGKKNLDFAESNIISFKLKKISAKMVVLGESRIENFKTSFTSFKNFFINEYIDHFSLLNKRIKKPNMEHKYQQFLQNLNKIPKSKFKDLLPENVSKGKNICYPIFQKSLTEFLMLSDYLNKYRLDFEKLGVTPLLTGATLEWKQNLLKKPKSMIFFDTFLLNFV